MNKKIIKGNFDYYEFSGSDFLNLNGKFGSVFKAISLNTNKIVVVKQLKPELSDNEIAVKRFCSELFVNFYHENITQTVDCFKFEDNFYLVREFFEGIDLKNLRKNRFFGPKFSEKFWLKIFIQLAEALHVLHSNSIIHRDIRPSNIILNNKLKDFNENPKIKLTDLGLAKFTKKSEQNEKEPFALIYSSPEQMLGFSELVDERSDIYAAGITFYELITGKPAFWHTNPEFLMNLMLNSDIQFSKKISKELFDILKKCAYKTKFAKPPRYYSRSELGEILMSGISGRYFSASMLLADLQML